MVIIEAPAPAPAARPSRAVHNAVTETLQGLSDILDRLENRLSVPGPILSAADRAAIERIFSQVEQLEGDISCDGRTP